MTTALQLPVFDQAMSEVGTIGRLAELLARAWTSADRVLKLGRLVGAQANFISQLALVDPNKFTSTDDVWAHAESLERVFHRFSTTLFALRKSSTKRTVKPLRLPSYFDEDVSLRLLYMYDLMRQGHGSGGNLSIEQGRAHQQALLDDMSVPPEVRLMIRQGRCLPVLIVFALCLDTPMFAGTKARDLVIATTRECIDNMTSLLLGAFDVQGLRPVEPPSGLVPPEPMNLAKLTEEWRGVQMTWANC